jgi:hypothetical protein
MRYLPRPFASGNSSGGGGLTGIRLSANEDDVTANNQLLEEAASCLDIRNIQHPTEADAAKLGTSADLAYFVSKLQVKFVIYHDLLLEIYRRSKEVE